GGAFEEKVDKKAGLGWTIKLTAWFAHNKKTVSNVASPLIAEGLALREALKHCITNGLDSIRMESDSSQLIRAITRHEPLTELHGVMSDISNLSSSPSLSVSFFWISRNENLVADSLAKGALCMVEAFMALA
ncbi:unnamed protein product, partial [Brassica rapa subsp. trilocularis]